MLFRRKTLVNLPPELLYNICAALLADYFHSLFMDDEEPSWHALENLMLVCRIFRDVAAKVVSHALRLKQHADGSWEKNPRDILQAMRKRGHYSRHDSVKYVESILEILESTNSKEYDLTPLFVYEAIFSIHSMFTRLRTYCDGIDPALRLPVWKSTRGSITLLARKTCTLAARLTQPFLRDVMTEAATDVYSLVFYVSLFLDMYELLDKALYQWDELDYKGLPAEEQEWESCFTQINKGLKALKDRDIGLECSKASALRRQGGSICFIEKNGSPEVVRTALLTTDICLILVPLAEWDWHDKHGINESAKDLLDELEPLLPETYDVRALTIVDDGE
ncbi:hypothetical protein GLOTRDRAFT_117790 [Gloeophyllum trabeum ATCC 11539]|uniref:F-box domain-containing protein n=1 Tax=Gloeophyllum trabeum (strain ATCC 11539 / FP-39264 / Madison 617) TaxID=670483 RepID=S7PW95_GLOTA|nr:uncharacterized protein GLOTRDRAFT_117790 [Gloeophyllum trabeum ATCC 11539]EPQ51793.1 hypothetical protein GLOTRDRAFT_117790 [Gloeophyllum trabeum ATCC 11539]